MYLDIPIKFMSEDRTPCANLEHPKEKPLYKDERTTSSYSRARDLTCKHLIAPFLVNTCFMSWYIVSLLASLSNCRECTI